MSAMALLFALFDPKIPFLRKHLLLLVLELLFLLLLLLLLFLVRHFCYFPYLSRDLSLSTFFFSS